MSAAYKATTVIFTTRRAERGLGILGKTAWFCLCPEGFLAREEMPPEGRGAIFGSEEQCTSL